ncbi:MAG: response regulator [Phycisphaerales bacterium]|nr:MAG: response regulator [Phycisphaerales bacterium]
MPKVLVVDDEEVYRRQLHMALDSEGHEVEVASSGREAIDVGARFRPDVLVVDWMLKDRVHGLHVARVLRTVRPNMQTILVTGFASSHLRSEADKSCVCDFIEKPFDVDRIRGAVRRAVDMKDQEVGSPSFGVLEVDDFGRILFANDRAHRLFAETRAGSKVAGLAAFFAPGEEPNWNEAVGGWVAVAPLADRAIYWCVRSQALPGHDSRLVVIRRYDDPQYVDLPLIEMLLGIKELEHVRSLLEGRVLVIDHEALARGLSVALLESAGAAGYAVETLTEGLRLLEKDEGLRYVLLDNELADTALGEAVERIRSLRPDVSIVGAANNYAGVEFAAAGIEHFVQKPWRVENLVGVLTA